MLTGNLKIYNVVFDNPRILLVLEHFNIPLGFGEQTVAEMCEHNHINLGLFLIIANLYCCKKSVQIDAEKFSASDASQVIDFLRTAHFYFLNEKIPKLKMLIEDKAHHHATDKYSLIIQKFINDYATEVFEHMNYENTIVFPYVEALLHAESQQSKYHIEKFKKHHTNIEDKLTDLKNLLIKHVPPEYDSVVRRRMLFELEDLEHDINIHDFIENHILIPVVERLEHQTT